MSEEWGPWIEHDGKGCPCIGAYAHVRFNKASEAERNLRVRLLPGGVEAVGWIGGGESWFWDSKSFPCKVIRYRVRKPRGLAILESLIADLPAPVPKVDA